MAEILVNLKKIKRNLQCSLFYIEIYEEFNGASSAWAKSVMSKNVEAGILLKNNFFTGSVLSVGVLKWQLLLWIVQNASMKLNGKLKFETKKFAVKVLEKNNEKVHF